jgi:hypothetical protein
MIRCNSIAQKPETCSLDLKILMAAALLAMRMPIVIREEKNFFGDDSLPDSIRGEGARAVCSTDGGSALITVLILEAQPEGEGRR